MHEGGKYYMESRPYDKRFRKVDTTEQLLEGDVFYFTCIHDGSFLKPMYEYLEETTDYVIVFQQELYREEYWLEVMPRGVSKAQAILELKEKGGQVIGINTDSLDGNEDGIAEAKSILEKQGAKYTNLSLDSNSEAGKYATGIMAFPTTIVLDRNGNIIGEPIMGGIDNDEAYKQLMKTIDQILAADKN